MVKAIPPTRDPMTGAPHAIASSGVSPNGSYQGVVTATSAAAVPEMELVRLPAAHESHAVQHAELCRQGTQHANLWSGDWVRAPRVSRRR